LQTTDADRHRDVGSWTLGPTEGENTVDATSAGLNTITFVAFAKADRSQRERDHPLDNALLRAIQNTIRPRTIAARALGELHNGTFDAWAAYDDKASARAWAERCGGRPRNAPQTTRWRDQLRCARRARRYCSPRSHPISTAS